MKNAISNLKFHCWFIESLLSTVEVAWMVIKDHSENTG